MKSLNFLYTDGRDVVVTDSSLHAKGSSYSLKGIVDFGLAIIKPKVLPAMLTLVLGAFTIADAFYYWIPDSGMAAFGLPVLGEGRVELEIIAGTIILLVGLGHLLLSGKRYALCIETAEGNKNIIISKRKEYITQIVNALQKAKASWRVKRSQ